MPNYRTSDLKDRCLFSLGRFPFMHLHVLVSLDQRKLNCTLEMNSHAEGIICSLIV